MTKLSEGIVDIANKLKGTERHDQHGPYPTAPVLILDGIWRYATDRVPPGGFVRAVLENNLSEAFGRADDASLAGLFDIMRYVRWEIPNNCHGSPAKVQAWLDGGGS